MVGPLITCSATTHADLVVRAKQMGIAVEVIHNASIMNAVAACGLQLYAFGQTISMVFFDGSWRPDSWYEKIAVNRQAGLHTLCLLGNTRAHLFAVFSAFSFLSGRQFPCASKTDSASSSTDIKMKEQSMENLLRYVLCVHT